MPLEGPSEGLEQLKMFTGWNKYWGLLIPMNEWICQKTLLTALLQL